MNGESMRIYYGAPFGCDELVLYGIRELASQFLGSNLDMEVENAGQIY